MKSNASERIFERTLKSLRRFPRKKLNEYSFERGVKTGNIFKEYCNYLLENFERISPEDSARFVFLYCRFSIVHMRTNYNITQVATSVFKRLDFSKTPKRYLDMIFTYVYVPSIFVDYYHYTFNINKYRLGMYYRNWNDSKQKFWYFYNVKRLKRNITEDALENPLKHLTNDSKEVSNLAKKGILDEAYPVVDCYSILWYFLKGKKHRTFYGSDSNHNDNFRKLYHFIRALHQGNFERFSKYSIEKLPNLRNLLEHFGWKEDLKE